MLGVYSFLFGRAWSKLLIGHRAIQLSAAATADRDRRPSPTIDLRLLTCLLLTDCSRTATCESGLTTFLLQMGKDLSLSTSPRERHLTLMESHYERFLPMS